MCSTCEIKRESNLLKDRYPELLKEWNYDRNINISLDNVTCKSDKKAWWICEKGHEWETAIKYRTRGSGCPVCAGKLVHKDNCLQAKYPEIAKQWHPTKNGNLTPNDVTVGSNKKVWWICELGHEWETSIIHRTKGTSCPICAKRRKTSIPEQIIYYYLKQIFDEVKNGFEFSFRTKKVEVDVYIPLINLAIEYDGWKFHQDIKKDEEKNKILHKEHVKLIRLREEKCPEINMFNHYVIQCIVETNYSYMDKYVNDALAYIIKNYSYMLNDGILKKIYNADINSQRDITKIYALYSQGIIENSLFIKYPTVSKEWHPTKNGDLKPYNISYGSKIKVWWKCEMGHEWETSVAKRTIVGERCPYCSGQRVCKDNCLQTKCPEIAKQWHPTKNGNLTPNDVTASSGKKAWWICEKGHEWEAKINDRTKKIVKRNHN